jgi:hypothetical protein
VEIKARRADWLQAAPLLLAAVRPSELGRVHATAVPGSPGLARNEEEHSADSLVGLWPQDQVREGRTAEERLRAGQANSGEESRPRRGGLRRVRAWTSFSKARGTSGNDAGALDWTNSADHCAGVADRRG